jgi:hypothetical protein
LSIADSQGRTIGVVNGEVKNDFVWGIYDPAEKSAKILFPDVEEDYTYTVVGTDKGTYGITLTLKNGLGITTVRARRVPIVSGEVHAYTIDREKLASNENVVTVRIDREGDGAFDSVIETDAQLSAIALPFTSPPLTETARVSCSDDLDNDGDEQVDLADPDCSPFVPPPPPPSPVLPPVVPSSTLFLDFQPSSTLETSTVTSTTSSTTPSLSWWRKLAAALSKITMN